MKIQVRLREAIQSYQDRTGENLSYEVLAERTGLSKSTIESIATRADYNASLRAIEKICAALGCEVHELLVSINMDA